MKATSVNPIDLQIRKGYGKELISLTKGSSLNSDLSLKPLLLGRDGAGVVVKTGAEVYNIRVGDEVYGFADMFGRGTYSEYCAMNENEVALKPEKLSFLEAAAVPWAGCLAHRALFSFGNVKPGQTVFVVGAGSVGSIAIQLLRHHGCKVWASCRSENIERVKRWGAHEVIAHDAQQPIAEIMKNEKVDIVLETAKPFGDQLFDIIKNGGKYYSCINPLLTEISKQGIAVGAASHFSSMLFKQFKLKLKGIHFEYLLQRPELHSYRHSEIYKLTEKIKAIENFDTNIDKVFCFDEVIDAHEYVEDKKNNGKVIIDVEKFVHETDDDDNDNSDGFDSTTQ